MANKPVVLTPNTIVEHGKCKIMYATEKINLDITPKKFLFAVDPKANVKQTESSNKTYTCDVSRMAFEVDGEIFDVNIQVLRRNTNVVAVKPKATQKTFNM